MKIKIALLFILILSVTLLLPAVICAEDEINEEKEYIVYFNDSVELYSTGNTGYHIMNEEELKECIEAGVVEFYEENSYVYLFENTEENLDPMQNEYKWDMAMINADYALTKGYTGKGVKVAVIDSGCNLTGDLSENVLEGYNVIDGSTDVTDTAYHGTIVSSQIAAEMNSVGFRGVAPETKIVPIKIFEGEKAKITLVAEGIKKAVDDFDCDIINLSLGGKSDSVTLKNAVDYAVSKGAILVSAAGNYSSDEYTYPASYDNVISVGALDANKIRASYSQYNDQVDVCAPGGSVETKGICAFVSDTTPKAKVGTSFAAPMVSGIAAIFRGIDENFSYLDFFDMIENASVDLGDEGYDVEYGYGMADLYEYIRYYERCGNEASWDITSDGELIVSGKGEMYDFASFDEVPWAKEADKVLKVTLGDEIETVGAYAFSGCENLKEITIPEGITRIGVNAFDGCLVLQNVIYKGNKSGWEKTEIEEGNDLLLLAKTEYLKLTTGDIDGSGSVDVHDAVLLFRHSLLPDLYILKYQDDIDFVKDGAIDISDAERLFRYSMFPDLYPIE